MPIEIPVTSVPGASGVLMLLKKDARFKHEQDPIHHPLNTLKGIAAMVSILNASRNPKKAGLSVSNLGGNQH